MRVQFTFVVCTMVLLLGFSPAGAADKKLGSAEIKKLVKEYCEDGSTQPRREEIAVQLKDAYTAEIGKSLPKHLKDETERPKALQLATTLKVGGLFKHLEDHFDTLDQQAIIVWCLTLRDPDGVKFLLEKWNSLSLDGKEWQRVDEGFRKHRQSIETLDKFRDKAADVARGTAAMEILRWQMEKPDLTAEQVKNDWTALRAEFVRTYKTWVISGHDVLAMDGWVGDKADPAGPNVRIQPGGWWDFDKFPEKIGTAGLELVIRVAHIKGEDAYVGLFQVDDTGTNGYKIEFKPQGLAYCDPSGRIIKSAPCKVGEWHELKWVVKRNKAEFSCSMFVDGVRLIDNGILTIEPSKIGFYSKNAEFLAGGADLRYPVK